MKKDLLYAAITLFVCLFFSQRAAQAQTLADDPPKLEVGAHFTSLTLRDSRTEPGLGARLTYNLSRSLALEAEGDLLPHNSRSTFFRNGGRGTAGFFGVKAGKRFEKFGIFAKARPGLISFTQGQGGYVATGAGGTFPFEFRTERATHFAFDAGAVLELYPTRHIVTRFDAGDTIIRYRQNTFNGLLFDGSTTTLQPFTIPGETTHNFQFTAGVGYRF